MSEKQKVIRRRADITQELVNQVRACATAGNSFVQTALITGYSEQSLRRWLVAQFNEARAKATSRAGASLYNLAVGDTGRGLRPNLTALIFYLKCQAGWRETTGIVFEEAKPTDDNAQRLIELLESRFQRLGDMQRKRKDKESQASKVEGPADVQPG